MIVVGSATTTATHCVSLLFILFDLWSQFSLQKGNLLGSYDGWAFNKALKLSSVGQCLWSRLGYVSISTIYRIMTSLKDTKEENTQSNNLKQIISKAITCICLKIFSFNHLLWSMFFWTIFFIFSETNGKFSENCVFFLV